MILIILSLDRMRFYESRVKWKFSCFSFSAVELPISKHSSSSLSFAASVHIQIHLEQLLGMRG